MKEEETAQLTAEFESLKRTSERQISSLTANVSSLENIVSSMEGEMAAMEKELEDARQRSQPTQPTQPAADAVSQSRASSRASSPVRSVVYSDTDSADGTNTDANTDTNDGTGGDGEGRRLGHQRARSGAIFHPQSDQSSESESESEDRDGGVVESGGRLKAGGSGHGVVGGRHGGEKGGGIGVATLDVTTARHHLSASPATPTAIHTTDHPPSHRAGDHGHGHGHNYDHDHSHADSPNLRTPHQQRQQHHDQRVASPRYPIDHYRNPNSPDYASDAEVQTGGSGGGSGGGGGGSGDGGGGGGSVVKADVVFHPSPHHRHGETHLAIPHSETGALVATLIVSLESSTIAPSMYGGGDGRDTVLDLTVADRGVLQAWGSFLGGCIDMVR